MRDLLSFKPLLLVLTALSGAHTQPASGEQPIQVVTIRIDDDINCLVEDTRVPCARVVAHLRDVLRVPVGTHFRILPDKASTYEATAKLIEQFQKSDYKLKMGYVNVAEAPED
jgi:biopolymer transport protein ExbD